MLTLKHILEFAVTLGVLIFVHELGHYFVGKKMGVFVKSFSIGFGPKLFEFIKGETKYRISLIPLGGYVAFAGESRSEKKKDVDEDVDEYVYVPEERKFYSKTPWQRSAIILAGPFMNLVLAVLLFYVVAFVGITEYESEKYTKIGYVLNDSRAMKAGILPGDEIVKINNKTIHDWSELATTIIANSKESLNIILRRDGELVGMELPPAEDSDNIGIGVALFSYPVVGEVLKGMPAENAGLKVGDKIVSVNGEEIEVSNFSEITASSLGERLDLKIKRSNDIMDVSITPVGTGEVKGFVFSGNKIVALDSEENTYPASVKIGDSLISVDGKKFTPKQLSEYLHSLGNGTVTMTFMRKDEKTQDSSKREIFGRKFEVVGGNVLGIEITDSGEINKLKNGDVVTAVDGLRVKKSTDMFEYIRTRPGEIVALSLNRGNPLFNKTEYELLVLIGERGSIGVTTTLDSYKHRYGVFGSVAKSLEMTGEAFQMIAKSIKWLILGKISTRNLAGPIGIYQLTSSVGELGVNVLLRFIGFLGINVFVINLLPIPVLDGGHLMFNIIESVRKKPVDERCQEWAQKVGLALLLLLILYVSYNDIMRILRGFLE